MLPLTANFSLSVRLCVFAARRIDCIRRVQSAGGPRRLYSTVCAVWLFVRVGPAQQRILLSRGLATWNL